METGGLWMRGFQSGRAGVPRGAGLSTPVTLNSNTDQAAFARVTTCPDGTLRTSNLKESRCQAAGQLETSLHLLREAEVHKPEEPTLASSWHVSLRSSEHRNHQPMDWAPGRHENARTSWVPGGGTLLTMFWTMVWLRGQTKPIRCPASHASHPIRVGWISQSGDFPWKDWGVWSGKGDFKRKTAGLQTGQNPIPHLQLRVIKSQGCFKIDVNNCAGMTRNDVSNDNLKSWGFKKKNFPKTSWGWGGVGTGNRTVHFRERTVISSNCHSNPLTLPPYPRVPESCVNSSIFFHQCFTVFPLKNKGSAI